MKTKFRIGDRVRVIETGEQLVVMDIGHSWREDDPYIYLLAGEMGRYDGGYSSWYSGGMLELVGCGIPAPSLRWENCGMGMWMAEIFGGNFHVTLTEDDGPFETSGKKRQCEDGWQQLWDKEMLISRDLPETGE